MQSNFVINTKQVLPDEIHLESDRIGDIFFLVHIFRKKTNT